MSIASHRPSSHRLSRLTESRRRAKISLATMAQACGLTGSQSRLTAGAWEAGKYVPRPEVRPAFMRYLWETLDLRANPEEFRALWAILMHEWGWASLSEQEWESLQQRQSAPQEVSQTVNFDEEQAEFPSRAPTEEPAASPIAVTRPSPRSLRTRAWLLLTLLTIAIGVGAFFFLAPKTSSQPAEGFGNLDFEASELLPPWTIDHPDSCDPVITTDAQFAQAGQRYLSLTQRTAECYALRQHATITTTVEQIQRFALWLRPLQAHSARGQIILRATDDAGAVYEFAHPFLIPADQNWHCIETVLPLRAQKQFQLSAELSLAPSPLNQIAVDTAQILAQSNLLCPLPDGLLVDNRFDDPDLTLWQWLNQPCVYEQGTHDAQDGATFLRITRQNTYCQGIVQHIPIRPTAQPLRLALWTRAGGEQAARMSIRLGIPDAESAYQQNIKLASLAWRCHELQYTPSPEQYYLSIAFNLWGGTGAIYDIDHLQVSYADKPLCPPQAFTLDNGDFEDSMQPGAWEQQSECTGGIAADPRQAYRGDQYLFAARHSLQCYSIYQDMLAPVNVGDKFTARIWIRSANRTLRNGFLTLWALGGEEESANQQFSRIGPIWRCIETTLTIRNPAHHTIRFEVYLDNDDGIDYYFDDAFLTNGDDSLCATDVITPTPPPTKDPLHK